MKKINGFDCDGVISIPGGGVYPGPNDVIITGRSFEEEVETREYLSDRNINNDVYFNPLKFDQKTRASSGFHKAKIINQLKIEGIQVVNFFDDDIYQVGVIKSMCPDVNVILLEHDLVEKGNIRRDAEGNEI